VRNDIRANRPQQTVPPAERPIIGLFDDILNGDYPLDVLRGAADAAEARDADLVCFPGGVLGDSYGFQAQHNVLYDLVNTETVDSLLIASGLLGTYVGYPELVAFCDRYRSLPMISIGLMMDGIPSISVDNYAGMHEAAVHLIEVHGYRRVAFIRGPEGHQEADERYHAYTDALAEHGLAFDPDLVAIGDFRVPSGRKAISLLLNLRQVSFDAVMAANDNMALGALAALEERGIRVPYDVAITGFDDIEETKFTAAPLTTVRQPIRELGRKAVEMALALLAGEKVPERVSLPTEVVVRQSCGCSDLEVTQAAAGPVTGISETFEAIPAGQRDDILAEVKQVVKASAESLDSDQVGQLLDAFAAEIRDGSSGTFLSAFDAALRQAVAAGDDVAAWQGVLSTLRRHTLPWLANDDEALPQAEDLWHQARVMVTKVSRRTQARQIVEVQRRAQTGQEAGQELSTTGDMTGLMDTAARELPRLDIPRCYLSLYENPESPAEWSRLVMAYDEEGRIELETGGRRFPSFQLAPDGMIFRENQCNMLLEPLYFREEQLGFVLFEANLQHVEIYEPLRVQLSSALKNVLLIQEREQAREALETAYAEVEKQVEERTAELERETAERERLQQEVIETQKRALQELSAPIIPVMEGIIVMPLIGSIDTMRARDITRGLLAGIRQHRAKVAILDITGVPIVDSGVANHLNKTIQAARLKGTHTIVTGISDAVAETIVDLGIDWSDIETLSDLQTGLRAALAETGQRVEG
jgi:sigma-B regulation protein RsbU (phosphoserine phosphatase)